MRSIAGTMLKKLVEQQYHSMLRLGPSADARCKLPLYDLI